MPGQLAPADRDVGSLSACANQWPVQVERTRYTTLPVASVTRRRCFAMSSFLATGHYHLYGADASAPLALARQTTSSRSHHRIRFPTPFPVLPVKI